MVGRPARSGQRLLTTGFTARSTSARHGFECWRERAPRSAEARATFAFVDRPPQGHRSGSGSVKFSHPQVLTIAPGASRGIGLAVALAGEGTDVVLVARDQAALDDAALRLPPPGRTLSIAADTNDDAAVRAMVARAVEERRPGVRPACPGAAPRS
jgi:hypothetical protein